MKIIKAHAVSSKCYKSAMKMTPRGIVLNCTAVGANNQLNYYVDAPALVGANDDNQFSSSPPAHAYIGYGLDGGITIVNTLPYNYCAWNCGQGSRGSYNYAPAYIQVVMLQDRNRFNETYKAAIKFCIWLCKEFDIPLENVISHAEAHVRGYADTDDNLTAWLEHNDLTMDDFRATVAAAENKLHPTALCPYGDINGVVYTYKVHTDPVESLGYAEALAECLRCNGYKAHVIYNYKNKSRYIVQIGVYEKLCDAEKVLMALKRIGHYGTIRTQKIRFLTTKNRTGRNEKS